MNTNKIHFVLVFAIMAFIPFVLPAQNIVVMPHHGTDTISINRQNCYTILDPGGYSNYSNNEDSWLYIHSTSGPFRLKIDYQTGINGDCADFIRIYYGFDTNTYSYQYCETGSDTWYSESWTSNPYDAVIYFHSNNYASFRGFEIQVEYPNSIQNWNTLSPTDSSITLTWQDTISDATEWTVTYFCDQDTPLTVTTNTTSATLSGLRNTTYYRYHIQNNAAACMATEPHYFLLPNNQNAIYSGPDYATFVLTSGECYTINGMSGSGTNQLFSYWRTTTLSAPDSVGFYLDGWYRIGTDDNIRHTWMVGPGVSSEQDIWGGNRYQQSHKTYFPHGHAELGQYNYYKYHYNILWENNHIITPTVTGLAATTATLHWNDTTPSTSWTVRYTHDDINWTTRTVSTPNITLTGLTEGTQYLYTIEGNVSSSCIVPYRHSFITPGSADTLILPYRKSDTVTLLPGNCYTLLDAGGKNQNYFHSDYSFYTIRTANGNGFRIKGWHNIPNPDRLFIFYDGDWHGYDGSNSEFEIYCSDGSCTLAFSSDCSNSGLGFEFKIIQLDTAITQLHASNITASSATISWSDPDASVAGWRLYYGNDEDNFTYITTTSPTATLTGLMPGTQYVYYVTRQSAGSPCLFSDRQAFITQGGDTNIILMPFRGIDTLVITPGTCYTIYDAGGKDHNYFNNDSSQLVIMTSDHSDFFITGEFDYESLYELQNNGYDGEDRLWTGTNPYNDEDYNNELNGYWTWYHGERFRIGSQNGFLRLRWRTNEKSYRKGFHIHIDQDTSQIEEVRFFHINSHNAEVQWVDNSGYNGPWYVGYSSGSAWTTFSSNTAHASLSNLLPNTNYQLRISRTPFSEGCDLQTYNFATLGDNDIVMNYRSRDTVWVNPGECYTVYDPGGIGDYYSSDTSVLVIRSTTGLGFRLQGLADVSDVISFDPNGMGGGPYYWFVDNWYPNGIAYITLKTNEAINSPGFAFRITFYPTLHSLDTLWQTDTSMAITWQDTSVANQWTINYGTHIDSLRTITTSTNQAILTGLQRNSQCYLQIESNFSSGNCIIPSIYGIRMPHDPNIWITQYHNTLLDYINHRSLLETNMDIIPVSECVHIYDNGGLNPPFPECTMDHDFYSSDGRGLSLRGNYNLGYSSLNINTSNTTSYYGGIGNTFVTSDQGYLCFVVNTSSNPSENGEGFDFEVLMNYAIYQVTANDVTCSTARLTWVDTSGASRWWIAYGESENDLDTVTTTTRSYQFNNLVPDRQYVCYLWSNENVPSCNAPVKKCFITPCDSTIIIMPYNEDCSRTLNINDCYVIQDPGGPKNYHYNSNQRIHIHSNTGTPIVLRGKAHIREYDQLSIYDEGSWEWYFGSWSGDDENIEIHSTTGNLCIEFYSNGDTLSASGFEFTVLFNTIGNIHTDLMTDSTCRVTWDDNSSADHWTFWYGTDRRHMDSIPTSTKRVHLHNLVDGTHYYTFITNNAIECIDTSWFEFCAGSDNCIDFADLYSCHTICRYGDFYNPDSYQEVIDYGPDNIYSRHTVMLDTAFRDPRTGNQLRSIPEGHSHSVRLGNWNYGGEAESISYEYVVDTAAADILLLRYAAVLENPAHQDDEQPRFQFTITDEYNNPIDTRCYSADFVSSSQLGWNVYQYDTNTVLWKDWTAVGIDLEPLQGRRIFVKLTTYDCAQTGHFGYAYFTLSCDRKYIRTGACGHTDSNYFTAPEGFRYRWYNVDSANVTLDTTQHFYSNQNGIYRCRASFLGDSSSNCFFEKTVIVGNIFPHADFAYRSIDTVDCHVQIQFQNLSRVATDTSFNNLTPMECDSYFWDFGDGTYDYTPHPVHIFEPGYFNVRLSASIADGICSHDTTIRIAIPSPCIHYDTIYPAICDGDTFRFDDTLFTQSGEYVVRHVFQSDSIVETLIQLTVHNTYNILLNDTICQGQSYNQHGITTPGGTLPDASGYYEKHYLSVHGCDSLYRLNLTVMPTFDTTVRAFGCSDTGYALYNRTVYQSGHYTDSLHTTAGCDSVIHLNLTINPAYHYYTDDTICNGDTINFHGHDFYSSDTHTVTYQTARGCDSSYHLNLTLYPSYTHTDTVVLCPRQPYRHHDSNYYAPQTISDIFQTVHGCDSIFLYDLTLHDPLFFAAWQVTDDTTRWVNLSDTLWEGCSPYTLYFRNRSSHTLSSTWDFGDSTDLHQGASPYDTVNFITHTYTTGRYYPSLSVIDSMGCTDTLTNPSGVSVIASPTANFIYDTTFPSQIHPWIKFTNTSIPLDSTCSSLWLFEKQPMQSDDLDTSRDTHPTYHWDVTEATLPSEYQVWLILSQINTGLTGNLITCTDTLLDTIKIFPCELQFPNLVTPNNDGTNDIFVIPNLLEYNRYPYNRLFIYDRWGHLVYHVENIYKREQFWDPLATNSPTGTYYYRFVGQGSDGSVQHNGVIEVMR